MDISCAALLFDLDGVLVDSSAVVTRHWRHWARRHGLDWQAVAPVIHGRPSAQVVALLAPHLDADAEGAAREDSEGVDTQGLRVFDGAAELLARLPARQWAVVTSGNAVTARTRLGFGELPRPGVLITSNDVQRGKPDPECYLLAAARLEVVPSECVVIEDSPAGIAAARRAGMRVIAVATTHQPGELDGAEAVIPEVGALRVRPEENGLTLSAPGHGAAD